MSECVCVCTFTSNEQGSNAQEYEYGHGISARVAIEQSLGLRGPSVGYVLVFDRGVCIAYVYV